ncbi:hypothetical protein Tco_0408898 [Tanacetum coccineum]
MLRSSLISPTLTFLMEGFAAVLVVLVTGASQSRQHVITSLIHIESCKSPTAELFDVDSERISIVTIPPVLVGS